MKDLTITDCILGAETIILFLLAWITSCMGYYWASLVCLATFTLAGVFLVREKKRGKKK